MPNPITNLGQELLLEVPTTCACLFAGTGFYMSEIDPIVRAQLQNKKQQLTHWDKMYSLGLVTMPIVSLIGSGAAVAAYFKTKQTAWLWGAATLFSVLPYTLVCIMPTNHYLQGVLAATHQPQIAQSQQETVAKSLKKWVQLHRIRPILALLSAGIFFVAKQYSKSN